MFNQQEAFARVQRFVRGYARNYEFDTTMPRSRLDNAAFNSLAAHGARPARGVSSSHQPADDANRFMADKASFDRSVASSRTFQAHRAELDAIDADIARTRAAQSRLLTDNPATIRQELGLTDNSRTYARAQAERNVHQGTVVL